ncbi:(2Fe-2S)-binding protein [Bacillus sp. Bva_UNVM-123]|uniref:(2Fe-2S)-binding protein n=1 Tax=Bacillus sp. Bva_UNVM-123 TaxID=2829798 RepID=UPI00391EF905
MHHNQNLFEISLEVNDEIHTVLIRASETLLQVLRNKLSLTGAKPGCLNGDCGACTIMADQMPYKSCIFLAIEASGKKITTIEGLVDTPIQKAFIEYFAFQCGYCTPGFLMNIHALLQKYKNPSDKIIEEWLSSNICRCTSYQEIENAVKSVLQSNNQ